MWTGVVHRKREIWPHCPSIRSYNWSQDFSPIPLACQAAIFNDDSPDNDRWTIYQNCHAVQHFLAKFSPQGDAQLSYACPGNSRRTGSRLWRALYPAHSVVSSQWAETHTPVASWMSFCRLTAGMQSQVSVLIWCCDPLSASAMPSIHTTRVSEFVSGSGKETLRCPQYICNFTLPCSLPMALLTSASRSLTKGISLSDLKWRSPLSDSVTGKLLPNDK